ncbi:uncharacterized protein ric3a [Salminus brasiliensis]|uniref:uncharacterized protein ric3a n=1 Tax=Salminus brasiliensis TaxID=930266 RepID=UPI003B830939
MSVSTVQKITFISCLVLCVSLFLPKVFLSRGKKEVVQAQVGPGHIPPLRYRQQFSEDPDQWQTESLYTKPFSPEALSRTRDAGKPNLLGQVIPVYGFGIFLYIIYIFFKLTHKDRSPRQECRFPTLTQESTVQDMPDYEMAQLQAKLRQMEGVRERRASKAVHPPARSRRGSRQREERKLRQITRVILEGRPLEGVSPEVEAEETPYSTDWEGYAEETFPKYEVAFRGRRYPSVILEEPDMDAPTAEELAERMGREAEETDDSTDDDYGDIDEEEVKNMADESKVDVAENRRTELKEGEEAKQSEDSEESEDEEEDEEEEDEETEEACEAELIEDDVEVDDDMDYHQKVQEQEEEEDEEDDEVGEDHPCLPHNADDQERGQKSRGARKHGESPSSRRQITFSDHRHVFHYSKGDTLGCQYEDEKMKEDSNKEDNGEDDDEDDEDEDDDDDDDDIDEEVKQGDGDLKEVVEKEEDPLMEAESLGFHTEVDLDPEEQEVDLLDFLLTYQPEATVSSSQPVPSKAPVSGTLRMRHKKSKKKN